MMGLGGTEIEEDVLSDACKVCYCAAPCPERRTWLKSVLSVLMALPFADVALAQGRGPAKARPQAGDQFVFAGGERQDKRVTPADVQVGASPVLAYPIDPQTQVIRNGSRLNQIVFVRVDPAQIAERTRSFQRMALWATRRFVRTEGVRSSGGKWRPVCSNARATILSSTPEMAHGCCSDRPSGGLPLYRSRLSMVS